METNEAVSQSEEQRKKLAIILGENYAEASKAFKEFENALFSRLDPVQIAVVEAYCTKFERCEQSIENITSKGFSLDECLRAYSNHSKQDNSEMCEGGAN